MKVFWTPVWALRVVKEKRDKRHGRFRGDQERNVIGIKSWRPRRRFSPVPHGERSGRLRSRRPCGSLKFPLPSRRLHRVDSTFLPWAPLPSLRRHAAAGARFHKLARPSATARLRSHHEQQLLHSGLAWLGDQGVKASSGSTTSSTASCLSSRSQHRFGARVCVHTPPCFQASCFSPLVPVRARCWLPSHPGEVAICQRPSGPLHRCRS